MSENKTKLLPTHPGDSDWFFLNNAKQANILFMLVEMEREYLSDLTEPTAMSLRDQVVRLVSLCKEMINGIWENDTKTEVEIRNLIDNQRRQQLAIDALLAGMRDIPLQVNSK